MTAEHLLGPWSTADAHLSAVLRAAGAAGQKGRWVPARTHSITVHVLPLTLKLMKFNLQLIHSKQSETASNLNCIP